METFSNCPKCGSDQLKPTFYDRQIVQKYDCQQCGYEWWQNSKPTVCALILNEASEVLLTKRAIEPFFGMWDVPGGFLENGEDPVIGLKREMMEELGVEIEVGEYFLINVDTYGEDSYYTVNIFFTCHIISGQPIPADDVSDCAWYDLDQLPEEIAFDNGQQALAKLKESIDAGLESGA